MTKENFNLTYSILSSAIMGEGFLYEDPNRKSVHRKQIKSFTFEHDLTKNIPILTTKKTYWKGALGELLGFLRGYNTVETLSKVKVNFWDKDAYNFYLRHELDPKYKTLEDFSKACRDGSIKGNLGNIYPAMMRNWQGRHDQINWLLNEMINNPMSTKKTVTMLNPTEDKYSQALSPCHWSFEILMEPLSLSKRLEVFPVKGHLSEQDMMKYLDKNDVPKYGFTLKWHQGSVDTFLGLPINVVYYSLLSKLLGYLTNTLPMSVIGDLSNVHFYDTHFSAVNEQSSKDPCKYESPKDFRFNNIESLSKEFRDRVEKGNQTYGQSLDILLDILIKDIDNHKPTEYSTYGKISADMIPYDN